jgi:cysteinyl-tRNA synthetase
MMIKLFNTLTRNIDPLEPGEDTVKIYSCGPTVYDYPHIGNWYAFLRWDLLIRVIKASGYKVSWVMNITDVGHLTSDGDEGIDKLEKGAKREHKSAWEIAKEYTEYFLCGLHKLNFIKPNFLPRASDHINNQVDFIKRIEAEGLTYIIDDGVYFDSSKLADYGKLARLNLSNLKEGARVKANPQKKNATDFALWKFSPKSKKRDMEWDSPWGKGFPGWHLECSAIIEEYLGDTVDIHCGGVDHIPIHHTNEIAQSESIHHKPLAKIWVHSNHIQVDGQKISKSLGNIITLEDIENRGYSLEAFRLLVFESQYRSEAQFSWDSMQAAQNRLNDFRSMAALRWQPKNIEPINPKYFNDIFNRTLHELQKNLNSPIALSILSELSNSLKATLIAKTNLKDFEEFLLSLDCLLGFKLSQVKDITREQKKLISQREKYRNNNEWDLADSTRRKLAASNIELRDTRYGPIWSLMNNGS